MHISIKLFFNALISLVKKKIYPQIVISLLTLPFLVAWGLPITPMVIVGNLIFVPILTLFLGLCVGIGICYFCHIYCAPLIWLFERIVWLWLYILHGCGVRQCLCIPCPYTILAVLCFFCMIFVLLLWRFAYRDIVRLLLLISIILLFWFCSFCCISAQKRCIGDKNNVTTYIDDQKRVMVSWPLKGVYKRMPDSWLSYTVGSHLARYYGRTTIDGIECEVFNDQLIDFVQQLFAHGLIGKTLYIKAKRIQITNGFLREHSSGKKNSMSAYASVTIDNNFSNKNKDTFDASIESKSSSLDMLAQQIHLIFLPS